MKALFITSATNETIKYGESFACLGNEIETAKYTDRVGKKNQVATGLSDDIIFDRAKAYQPDLIVYIGSRWGELLGIPTLCRLKDEVAPTVHICSDAADEPWWDLLVDYDKAKCFTVQVAIDGNREWPLHDTQITCLTPFCLSAYPENPPPHIERQMLWGYGGNFGGRGSKRKEMLDGMMHFGMHTRERDPGPGTHQGYIDFMSQCRIVSNFPHTGTQQRMHVKGRVVESGMTGAMLLEQAGAPTAHWFTPGEDYLEYASAKQANKIVQHLSNRPEDSQAMADRMRAKVLRDHGPAQFWGRILDRCGLSPAASAEVLAPVEESAG